MSVLLEEVITMADDKKNQKEHTEKDSENATESDEKVNDAEVKGAKKKVAGKAKEKKEEEGDDESSEDEELFGLYDKPLVMEGKRQRKRTDFLVKDQAEIKKEPQPLVFNGKGETLGSMEVVNHELSRCTGQELKPLHKLLFGRDGRSTEIKKNIRAFNGFNFEEGTKEYENKKFMVERFTNEGLKRLLEILDLEKKGTREDLKERVFTFLMKPKGSGRTVKSAKKKAKKSKPKSKGKGEKRKRTSAKVQKSSEQVKDDDEDEDEEESEEEETTMHHFRYTRKCLWQVIEQHIKQTRPKHAVRLRIECTTPGMNYTAVKVSTIAAYTT
ncbi:protein DEK-like [Actinia tenebrosa]|uniref:Protein DEK-like n=1 Tax=Actinia tenebrosa TaxID=6105 RepID=A0A6P8ITV5_ACTTE|nr:protein DEK-like [Actinia tenebrosa]